MNIIISPFDSKGFICRPDSTLLRAITEYFLPDYISHLTLSPVFYIKTHRAGKAVAPRFVSRYIDGAGYGLLLHPKISTDAPTRQFIENSLDYTSIIPLDLTPFDSHPFGEKPDYSLLLNGKEIPEPMILPEKEFIFHKIAEISQYCSLRIGDFITFDLSAETPLPVPSQVEGILDGKEIFRFTVK